MNIHFSLRKQGQSDPIIILNVFDGRFEGRKFMYSTGVSIDPADWDKRKSRAKSILSRAKELDDLNKYLDALEQIIISFRSERHNSATLSREDLRSYIQKTRLNERKEKEEKLQKESGFFAVWQKMIDSAKNSSGEDISSGTRRSKTQTLKLVSKFAVLKSMSLSFDNLDMDFYHSFDRYMKEKKLNGNSRGKHFKEIKAILREAIDRDIKVNMSFQKKSWKVIRNPSDSTYLNYEEIKKLLALDLTGALEKQRDIFVMACFTAARHSDWHQINQSNIITENNKEILKITQKKTKETIHIPIHPIVRLLLNKYNGQPPKIISNQKFNDALKDICEPAKLGTVTINSQVVDKWTEISTHTARRSFATNAYLSKSMEVHQIMKCTGHRSEQTFLAYLKLNGKDYALEAASSKFFTDDSLSIMSKAS